MEAVSFKLFEFGEDIMPCFYDYLSSYCCFLMHLMHGSSTRMGKE